MKEEGSKVAVVTAGGSGIVVGVAREQNADGFQITVLPSSGKGKALAKELGGIGVTGSNQSKNDLQMLVDQIMAQWGRIDVLVNSAGHGPRGAVLETTDEDWPLGLETYFLNVVRSTRLVTPIMRKQRSGLIINISIYAVFEPDAAFSTSGVFRAGLVAFIKLSADKYAPDNIRMNNVLPGFVSTFAEKDEIRERIPLGVMARWMEFQN